MAIKKIAIIGGGISGLSLLHFLKKKHGQALELVLYERNEVPGGHVRTLIEDGFLFETGPNGFLANQPDTLELVTDLGLEKQLCLAHKAKRFIQIDRKLLPVPTGPLPFLVSPLLSLMDKGRMLAGLLNQQVSMDQSVYDYAAARFGVRAADVLADPFVSGVFAGDAKRLHMYSAFGKMFESKRSKGGLCTLRLGMGQLTDALAEQYAAYIKTATMMNALDAIDADHVCMAIPAYSAALFLAKSSPALSRLLEGIVYAPVAVVGLGFDEFAFHHKPQGFGYLVPSNQQKEVLGVLVESNVYDSRAAKGRVMLRVMMGGRRHPHLVNDDVRVLKERAEMEINAIYGLKKHAIKHWVKVWPYAIPQYEMDYPRFIHALRELSAAMPRLTFLGNYLGGVSVNDCINNAKSVANKLTI